MKKRALISVSDKKGIYDFAKELINLGYDIISTGGTKDLLEKSGLKVTSVEEVTNFPECLDGRVKTLHPLIHGGILSIRDNKRHMDKLQELGIGLIDLVVVNLYPFRKTIESKEHTLEQAIENIDIGGPSMIRAAAKNYRFVMVVTNPSQYESVLQNIKSGVINEKFRFELAVEAFSHTSSYDALISNYLNKVADSTEYPDTITLTFDKKQNLRYGENPHQSAAYYSLPLSPVCGVEKAIFIQGKELSYNNINDAQGAIALAQEFEEPVCVAVKHATPCGVAVSETPCEAFQKARDCDPIAIFGGIVCFNRAVDKPTAEELNKIFLEVIIAPSYSQEALDVLKKKENLRILALPEIFTTARNHYEFKSVGGGMLMQHYDTSDIDTEPVTVVTEVSPTPEQINDMKFAMKVCKHVKSNAIVIAKDGQTLGIGGGSVSRIFAAKSALAQASDKSSGGVMASDAFFPFSDVVLECSKYGISAIVQPGGSKSDNVSIDECNNKGIAMVITGVRHFKH